MRTFVLLHGAWHGPWCWKKLSPLLMSKGDTVLTPTIPWTYDKNQIKQKFNFQHTTNELSELICKLDGMVVLVGHSLGGVIASMISTNIPEKISLAIYISGFIPKSGQSINDLNPLMTDSIIAANMKVDKKKQALIVEENALVKGFYNDCDTFDIQFAKSRVLPQLASTFLTPVEYNLDGLSRVKKLYVENQKDMAVPINAQRSMQENIEIEKVVKLNCGHSPFFTCPQDLLNILQKN